ncbi:RNA polymerase sigma factor [Brevibacillus reuszeri]|uniref:RNA polymerase sigma factor n=1 Tax=Brevibacillus reuszeri TaxID=54915 RepID=UPI00289A56CF|nr:sigma-70 family RNA polymerase sigma factor [Brevibacillus reuszeri]
MTNQLHQLDELYFAGKVDDFLQKAKENCEAKLLGMKFAGMTHDDVVQEVLLKVYRTMRDYDQEKARVTTFVDHVITNKIRDCLRKAGTQKNLTNSNAVWVSTGEHSDDESGVGSYTASVEDYRYEEVEMMIDIMEYMQLSTRDKQILMMRSEGYYHEEIGQKFNISKERVCQIIKAILKQYGEL